ncbi:MAG: hypothetical protein ACOYW3_11415 [Bacteroidota bacterium]
MRKLIISTLLLVASITSYSADRYWVAVASGSWNLSTNWSATSGGPGGASVPGANDVAIFNSGSAQCVLVSNRFSGGIIMSGYTGVINLGGFSLTTTGTNVFSTGGVSSGTLSFNNSTSVTFSGTQFSANITGTSDVVLFNGSSFFGAVALSKTGNTNDTGTGGNSFFSSVSITNAGAGQLMLSNGSNDIFNSDATFNSTNGGIWVGSLNSAVFNGNLIVNSSSGSISFGVPNGSATLAAGKTISVGTGFTAGQLVLRNFTQLGSTAQNIALTGSAGLQMSSTTFDGDFSVTAGGIVLRNNFFNGTATLQKTGSSVDDSDGGNLFMKTTVITNNGTGDLNFGTTTSDEFRASTTFNNNGNSGGSGVIRIASSHTGQTTQFSADVTLNTSQTSVNAAGYSYLFAQALGVFVNINGALTINLGGSSLSSIGFSTTGASTALSGDVTVNLSNATANNYVEFGQNTGTVQLGGNVTLASSVTTSSSGVHFRNSTLAATKTVAASAVSGFPAVIRFTNFTRSGSLPLSFTTTPATVQGVFITNSTFGGPFTAYSPNFDVQGSTFNGNAYFEKTSGFAVTVLGGGNTFNGAVTFFNSSTLALNIAGTTGDTYNGKATFSAAAGAGNINPAYVGTNTFRGDIAVEAGPLQVTFGAISGTVLMAGSGVTQNFSGNGAPPRIARLTVNTSGGGTVQFSISITILNSAQFVSGKVLIGAGVILFDNGATASGASSASFIDGMVQKKGNQAFTFPVGSGTSYRPISISAPSSSTDTFTAQFFRGTQAYGNQSTYSAPIVGVNGCEYWTLDRSGSSNVSVTLSWNSAECTGPYITDPSTLLVGRWNGTNWVSHGNGGTTGNVSAGTITTAAAVTSFSPFIIATSSTTNPLPITLLYFKAESESESTVLSWKTATEINNAEFQVERSADGRRFDVIGRVPGAGSSRIPTSYSLIDHHPLPGVSYYRLKQVDFDGTSTTFDIVRVNNTERQIDFYVYPNPAAGGTVVRTNYAGPAELIDQYGLTVARFESATQISTAQIPTGVYVLRNGQGQTFRLIVVNPM